MNKKSKQDKIAISKTKNKKALSEIVSYVLIIVIALIIATAIYAWLQFYIPTEDRESCPDNIALFIKNYNCNSTSKILTLNLQNKGTFNVEGFLIRATNQTGKKPVILLNSTNPSMSVFGQGKYDFTIGIGKSFLPQEEAEALFFYHNLELIKEIQIQPYVYSQKQSKKTMILCQNSIVQISLENCN
jgi:hypothetical protein